MNKIIVFILLAISSIATYFVVAGGVGTTDNKISAVDVDIAKQIIENTSADIELYSQDDKELISLPHYDLDIGEIDNALKLSEEESVNLDISSNEHKNIFLESSVDIVSAYFPKKEGIEPLSAIEMKQNSISKVNIGDTIALPFVDTAKYKAKISDKIIHKDGSVSITGNLLNRDKKYSVVLTQGKTSSFGSLITPEGNYEIEIVDGKGYIYSVNDIDKKFIDYTKEDVIHLDNES